MQLTELFSICSTEEKAKKEAEKKAKKIERSGCTVLEFGSVAVQTEMIQNLQYNGEYIEELDQPKIWYEPEYRAYVTYDDPEATGE